MKARPARELKQRREALRAALAARRAAAEAALARRRAGLKRGRRRDRRWWWLLLLLLLLLLFLRDCSCAPPPEPAGPAPVTAVEVPVGEVVREAPLPTGQVKKRARPAFQPTDPGALPWLASLRLQVAARGPRLAACFVGVARPGALKWTAAVEPGLGRVSDQTLEPTLSSDALTRTQRDCALAVLSEPPYRLDGGEARSTPVRVGMVVEF